jgi:hypothetical protein
MMLGTMKELFDITHIRDDEEEVPNVKHMHVVEEEVPVPQGTSVAVDDNVPVPPLVCSSPFFLPQK